MALYLRVGGDGLGTDSYVESFGDLEVVRYNYLYVGLPALDGEQYLKGKNPLGVALSALMRLPAERRVAIRAEAMQRILAEGENEFRTFLLAEFVQAYLPLSQAEQQEFDQLLQTDAYREVREMATTWFEEGIEEGRKEGRTEGQRTLAGRVLERRFGPLSQELQSRVARWPEDRLDDLIDQAYRVDSPDDLPPSPNGPNA